MVTKIKPRRIKSDNPGSLGDFLGYQDEVTFQWGQGGGGGQTYIAGDGIAIISGPDYSAMRGPAPEGFHIPSKDEWVSLCGILTTTFSMASDATTMGTYLKMPMAGRRLDSSSSVNDVGSYGNYWSSTAYSADTVYCLDFTSSSLYPQDGSLRPNGFSVRCFKDTSVIPDSNWTTLYDGSSVATDAGVFRDATNGLISISGDGNNWTTIMDKNLGATTVFNQGDTVSDANCGYFYQWGNNYGFPHSGTVITSSTQVDASNYGPGNYYLDSTFIIGNGGDWSTVQNDNLWGGVTGVVIRNNTITNTGVLSVNGQTGNVIVDSGDMFYDDFNFVTLTGSTVSLGLSTKIEPSSNFTVNLPTDIKDGQEYILRVSNGSTPYTMTLGNGVENPWNVDLTLTPDAIDMFVFLAVGDKLELQPEWGSNSGGASSFFKTQVEYDALPATKTSDGNLYIIVDGHYHLMTPPELLALGTDQAIIDELETHPTEYMEYAVDNNWGILQAYPGVPAGKTCSTGKVYLYGYPNGAGTYLTIITDLTEQEFIDWGVSIGMTEAQAETLRNTTVGKYVMEHTAFPI